MVLMKAKQENRLERQLQYPVLRLKRLGLSRTFRRLVVTLTRRYGVSLIHLDAGAECLPGFPTFDW